MLILVDDLSILVNIYCFAYRRWCRTYFCCVVVVCSSIKGRPLFQYNADQLEIYCIKVNLLLSCYSGVKQPSIAVKLQKKNRYFRSLTYLWRLLQFSSYNITLNFYFVHYHLMLFIFAIFNFNNKDEIKPLKCFKLI